MAVSIVSTTDIGGNFATTDTPITSGNIAVTNGNYIVVVSGSAFASLNPHTITTVTGSTSAWTKPQDAGTGSGVCEAAVSWATATATGNITVRVARSSGSCPTGATIYVLSGADGIGGSASIDTGSSANVVSLTTAYTDSLIVAGAFSWDAASTTATYGANFGAATEARTPILVPGQYTAYNWYHAASGAPATANIQLATPVNAAVAMVALEIKASTGSNVTVTPGVVAGAATVPTAQAITGPYVTTDVSLALNMP